MAIGLEFYGNISSLAGRMVKMSLLINSTPNRKLTAGVAATEHLVSVCKSAIVK